MSKKRMLFTSESVTEGHPDKMADQISDAILDAILAKDPQGRVACETLVTTGQVHVVGEARRSVRSATRVPITVLMPRRAASSCRSMSSHRISRRASMRLLRPARVRWMPRRPSALVTRA